MVELTKLSLSIGRSPHGERGLKLADMIAEVAALHSRSPHGERGLKYMTDYVTTVNGAVAPLTGSVD